MGGVDLPIELVLSLSAQVSMTTSKKIAGHFHRCMEGSENPDSSKLIILLLAF